MSKCRGHCTFGRINNSIDHVLSSSVVCVFTYFVPGVYSTWRTSCPSSLVPMTFYYVCFSVVLIVYYRWSKWLETVEKGCLLVKIFLDFPNEMYDILVKLYRSWVNEKCMFKKLERDHFIHSYFDHQSWLIVDGLSISSHSARWPTQMRIENKKYVTPLRFERSRKHQKKPVVARNC